MSAKKHEVTDLNKMYSQAESVDQDIFAEQRSNILLYAGDHYTKKNSRFQTRLRDQKEVQNEQKLRLTKNHTQYICDTYVNNIVSANPGVGFSAKNPREMHDQKVCELHHAVWRDAHERYDIDEKLDDWAESFVQIGEVCVKIYFDPTKGPVKAYPQKENDSGPVFLHPYQGEVSTPVDEQGAPLQPAPDEENPIYAGEFVFEEIYGFNLLRPQECKDLREAEWLGTRKMVDKKTLERRFPEVDKKLLATNQDQTFIVFDSARGGYAQVTDQVLVTEYYFRPCPQYPQGYFYINTKEGILAEGELPGGIFPIIWQAFRRFPTTPRGRSPIKTMRPYQAEINRSASKIAEHQITLGDDKIFVSTQSKIQQSAALPGVRSFYVPGPPPTILSGRAGDQYVGYMQGQIEEMYRVMGVSENLEDLPSQLDPYTLLFRSAHQKKKFQRYIKRFERFLINIVKTYLKLFKVHATDDTLVYAIGSTERVNIPEFRMLDDICYEINVEAQSEDMETKLGKQISISQVLQYVGGKLAPDLLGKLIKELPYGNIEDGFDDLTLEYDNSVNDMLALDRGETPPVNQNEDHTYQIKRLTSRMKKADFQFLPPQVQQNYAGKVRLHEQFKTQQLLAVQRAQQGLIPTSGGMVKCDLYVPGKNPDSNPQRALIPTDSLRWLLSQIDAQNSGLADVATLPGGVQADVANEFTRMAGGAGQPVMPGAQPARTAR
jgi:hypothetical protein